MKKSLLLIVSFLVSLSCFAQLNLIQKSHYRYQVPNRPTALNDIWGWVHPDGTEYALVGTKNGVSIVSLKNPAVLEEVAFIEGTVSDWRDLKTWGNFAYVTNDRSGGLLIINLKELPDKVTYNRWSPQLGAMPVDTLGPCHNLFIDEKGICYLAGCRLNAGGVLMLDVNTSNGQPNFIGFGASEYAHDVFARADYLYVSEINQGVFSIYEVSDKQNIELLASQATPFQFTHNTWLSDDGNILFTTDEVRSAPTAAYDISDLTDIKELDQFRPNRDTFEFSSVPHNVHVLNEFLVVSHYRQGVEIIDASRPDNLIEIGHFDTNGTPDFGSGCWGAYPYLPSGLILASDIFNGLYVLEPTYEKACYLEGIIKDSISGLPLNEVTIEFKEPTVKIEKSQPNGIFKTGTAKSGRYEVLFSKTGYESKRISVNLDNGVLTELAVLLNPLPLFSMTGVVIDEITKEPIEGAIVFFGNDKASFSGISDGVGQFSIDLLAGAYSAVYVGAWGYETTSFLLGSITFNTNATFSLKKGFKDGFDLDLGWTTEGDAKKGHWERTSIRELISERSFGFFAPSEDLPDDLSDYLYITGARRNNDVDEGQTRLISPIMDLSSYQHPILSYHLWFLDLPAIGSTILGNDEVVISVTNGTEEVVISTLTEDFFEWEAYNNIALNEFLPITSTMQVIFTTADQAGGEDHNLKVALDGFSVYDSVGIVSSLPSNLSLTAYELYPNPFSNTLIVDLNTEFTFGQLITFELVNVLGEVVTTQEITNSITAITLNTDLSNGVYYGKIVVNGIPQAAKKLVHLSKI